MQASTYLLKSRLYTSEIKINNYLKLNQFTASGVCLQVGSQFARDESCSEIAKMYDGEQGAALYSIILRYIINLACLEQVLRKYI